jgi:4-hydroxybenzoate polyprenyltransferase
LDFITNALGSGVFCSLAGWVVTKPVLEFPVVWGILSIFGVGGIFLPTTIIDYDYDTKHKVKTIATFLGKKKAFYLGMACVVMANIIIVMMALFYYIVPPRFLFFSWPIIAAQIFSYWYFLRRLDFEGGYYTILTFSILIAIGNTLILAYNAGRLIIP